jgi:hypothetical protein
MVVERTIEEDGQKTSVREASKTLGREDKTRNK